jgi:predicted MPP superfamily phosphohydrolase
VAAATAGVSSMRKVLAVLLVGSLATGLAAGGQGSVTQLPNDSESLKFAVIGDNGTGKQPQFDVASQMARAHESFPFDLVLMLGDNFYGPQGPADLENKFARPYRPLLDAGVTFRAALGNHDDLATINYPPINMEGRRYYTYVRRSVRFVVLDTNVLDAAQLTWARTTLQQAVEPWRIAYFHHPLYGNAGRHGANVDLRVLLEPLLLEFGVQVVFSGHDHVYERLKPQRGVQYFVVGSGGQLRKGDLQTSDLTAAGFDQDQAFMLVEVLGDDLHFQTVARTGVTVDSGVIRRRTNVGS